MAGPIIADQPLFMPNPNPCPDSSTDFDSLPVPPLDPLFFSPDSNPNPNPNDSNMQEEPFDLEFGFEPDPAFELTFEDLEDLYLPSETESFFVPTSGELSGLSTDHALEVAAYLNDSPSESGNQRSGDGMANLGVAMNSPSPERENSGEREFPVSSQGSGNGGGSSGLSEDTNAPSPCSGNFERDVSSKPVESLIIKEEGIGFNAVSKRKKDQEDSNSETQSNKCRKSASSGKETLNAQNSQCNDDSSNEEDEKRKARLMRNRESAQLSRQRKKHYVEELEEKVRNMHSTIAELNSKISYIMAENVGLRQQLGGGGPAMCTPPPGMYPPPPMAHMAYPWVPCAPYVMKPQGQVPLVPIPKLKPQQHVMGSKAKKSESKKSEGKTKKVASVSFLGLLFFVLLFGCLVPMVNVKFGGIGDRIYGGSGYFKDRLNDYHRGRVLSVQGHRNGSSHDMERADIERIFSCKNDLSCDRGYSRGSDSKTVKGSGAFVPLGNSSEPLVASLFVPRNDKLVKIDGNLIIHSVLASEKAKASRATPEIKDKRSDEMGTLQNLASALAIPEFRMNRGSHSHVYGSPTEQQKALASGNGNSLKDHVKPASADGKLQQWFREGLAGPMLSSGMCKEVFQFDVSSSSVKGAIPASPVNNVTSAHGQNTTHVKRGNRRIVPGRPYTLVGSEFNVTEEDAGKTSKTKDFQGNKSVSSMVVSVLVDPREAGDSDVDGVIPPQSLPRIFVVVLMDSIKYVTYSCVLPRAGLHMVTA